MEENLQQDHPNANPPSLLHLPHPHRSLQHPLPQHRQKHTTNDGNPTRHTAIPQPLQHPLFGMDHLHALQAHLLHFPPRLLPPLHLSSRIHRRLNLRRKRGHFLQGHDRRSQGLEETHGNLFVHLRSLFRLQRHGSACCHHMGTYNRGKGRRSWAFCGVGGLLFRRVCVLKRGLESGQCCDCVGRLVWDWSHGEEQRVDKGEDGFIGSHILEARGFLWVDTISVQENGGAWVESRVCGQNSLWDSVFGAVFSVVPVPTCDSNGALFRLQVLPPSEY